MPKKKSRDRLQKKQKQKGTDPPRASQTSQFPQEGRAVEAITLAWAVSVTTTLLFNLLALIAYLVVRLSPPADMMHILHGLAIGGGALIGTISLGLLIATLRIRSIPPPQPLVVFAVCVTIAPILAVIFRFTGLGPA